MIKLTFETYDEEAKLPEITKVDIFKGRTYVRYNIKGKAESVVKQMRSDGRKGILYSRGVMIQLFAGKSEDEILEIVKKDIVNGVYIAEKKTGKKMEVKNIKVERT